MIYFSVEEMMQCLQALGLEVRKEPVAYTVYSSSYPGGDKDFIEQVYQVYQNGEPLKFRWDSYRGQDPAIQVRKIFNDEMKLRIMRGFGVKI